MSHEATWQHVHVMEECDSEGDIPAGWKRANLRRGPRGSSVAPGGARSLQGSSGGARSPPGELDRSALCGFLARGGGVARRCGVPLRSVTPLPGGLSCLFILIFLFSLFAHSPLRFPCFPKAEDNDGEAGRYILGIYPKDLGPSCCSGKDDPLLCGNV